MSSRLRQLLPRLTAFLGVALLLPRGAGRALDIPKLSIQIPTVSFSEIGRTGQLVTIPWLAEYLVGIYKYGLTIGGAIAAVMMMWGGFEWMVGSSDAGKKRITNALTGLVILFGAYIILNVVNPELTNLKVLQIEAAKTEMLAAKSMDSQIAAAGGTVKGVQVSLPDIYKKSVDLSMPTASSCKSQLISQKMRDAAKEAEGVTGLPAYILLTQWALESGYGKSCFGDYNCYGIKCFADGKYMGMEQLLTDPSPTCPDKCMLTKTDENDPVINGKKVTGYQKVWACFKLFDTFGDAANSHARAVKKGNYKDYVNNPIGMAKFIGLSGYSTTDPARYTNTLIGVMKSQCLISTEAAAVPTDAQ